MLWPHTKTPIVKLNIKNEKIFFSPAKDNICDLRLPPSFEKQALHANTLRIELATKQNSAKNKDCTRRKTINPKLPGYTGTYIIYYIYTKSGIF